MQDILWRVIVMSYKENLKITFYNREDNETLSDQYSEFLMINRDGEVFELVHNGRGDYNPSYEGDWIGYKINGSPKTDEYESKAKAWDLLKLKLKGKNKNILNNPKASDEDLDFVGNNTAVLWEMSDLEMKFRKERESGESDA